MIEFSCVRFVFGSGVIDRLPEEVKKLGGGKIVVVTDRALKEMGEKICALLHDFDCELWNCVEAEPSVEVVDKLISSCRFDTVIGVGGGSTMDVAKLAATIVNTGKSARDYVGSQLPEREAKLILCPTTAGTGSEVTKLAVFKIPGRDVKYVFDSRSLYADLALVDPMLTMSAPQGVTANSGLDALCHAIEAYTSLHSTPVSDMFAERAIEIGSRALREVYANGNNKRARENMSYAALLAGIAFNSAGTSLGHALGYAHSFIHGFPHGKSVAITMPYVLQYNAIADLHKHARIAELLGERIDGLGLRDAAYMAGVAFRKLLEDLNFPLKLSDVGAVDEDVEKIVTRIFMSKKHVSRNPRAIKREDMNELVRRSIHGLLYGLENH